MDVSSVWWSIGFAKVLKEPPYPRIGDACSWASEPAVEGGGSWHHVKDVESRFFVVGCFLFVLGEGGNSCGGRHLAEKRVCVSRKSV